MTHILDKYIRFARAQLEALPPDNTQAYDTTPLQLMCLEKFANSIGYRLFAGQFVCSRTDRRVMRLDSMVEMYNNTVRHLSEARRGGQYIERVWLAGKNLRRPVRVQQHWVKFL